MTHPAKSLMNLISEHFETEWGFSGTRAGMSHTQYEIIRVCLSIGKPAIVRHGGAHGSDTEFHALWREECPLRFADIWPADQARVKLFDGQDHVAMNSVRPPLTRNEEIVKRSTFLIAAPHSQKEELRSGTWTTVRMARRIHVPVLIVWPNGVMTLDHEKFLTRIYR